MTPRYIIGHDPGCIEGDLHLVVLHHRGGKTMLWEHFRRGQRRAAFRHRLAIAIWSAMR